MRNIFLWLAILVPHSGTYYSDFPDMPKRRPFNAPAPVIAIVNWLIPGSGYLMLGQVARGLTIGLTILILFTLGILIGGIHVVDPPNLSALKGNFVRTVLEKPWYIGQFMSGAIGLISGWIGPMQPASHARANDIGTLYTAVAGMLNLLATIDSSYRSTLDDPYEPSANEGP